MTDALRSDLGVALAPRTAAVVGATDRRAGLQLWLSLSVGAETVAVHRSGRAADGARVVARAEDLPFAPDVCALAVGPGAIVAAAREAIAAGARLLVVPGLGPEDGEPGVAARAELGELCTASNVPLVGPNCMGVAVPGGASAWLGTVPHDDLRPGGVACVVHSGSLGEALLHAGPRFGLRVVVSSGNEIGRDAADWLATLVADDRTTVIGLALEAIRRPAAFADALALAASAGKPVIVLASGRSQAASPRGARALGRGRRLGAGGGGAVRGTRGDHRGRRAGLARAPRGVRRRPATARQRAWSPSRTRVARAASSPTPPRARASRVAPLPADLADALAAAHPGLPPGNPVDYWAVGPAEELAPALARTLAGHAEIDGLLLVAEQSLRYGPGEQPVARAAVDAAIAAAAEGALRSGRRLRHGRRRPRVAARGGRGRRAGAQGRRPGVARDRRPGSLAPPCPRDDRPGRGTVAARARRRDRAPVGAREPRGARALRHRRTARARGLDARRGGRRRASARDVRRRQAPRARPQGARRRSRARLCDPRRRSGRGRAHRLSRCWCARTCAAVRTCCAGSCATRRSARWSSAASAARSQRRSPRRRSPRSHRSTEDEALALVRSSPALAQGLHSKDQAAAASVLVALGRLAAHRPDVVAIDINPLRVSDGTATALDALIVLGAIDEETPWISG